MTTTKHLSLIRWNVSTEIWCSFLEERNEVLTEKYCSAFRRPQLLHKSITTGCCVPWMQGDSTSAYGGIWMHILHTPVSLSYASVPTDCVYLSVSVHSCATLLALFSCTILSTLTVVDALMRHLLSSFETQGCKLWILPIKAFMQKFRDAITASNRYLPSWSPLSVTVLFPKCCNESGLENTLSNARHNQWHLEQLLHEIAHTKMFPWCHIEDAAWNHDLQQW